NGSGCQRIIDNHWTALSGQARKVAGAFGRCWEDDVLDASLYIMVVLGGDPKECPVLDDRSSKSATAEIIGIFRFRSTGLLAEEVVLLRPNGTHLKETCAVKFIGPGL